MDTLMSYKKSNQGFIIISAIFFFILIILAVILWIINKLRLNKKNCSFNEKGLDLDFKKVLRQAARALLLLEFVKNALALFLCE